MIEGAEGQHRCRMGEGKRKAPAASWGRQLLWAQPSAEEAKIQTLLLAGGAGFNGIITLFLPCLKKMSQKQPGVACCLHAQGKQFCDASPAPGHALLGAIPGLLRVGLTELSQSCRHAFIPAFKPGISPPSPCSRQVSAAELALPRCPGPFASHHSNLLEAGDQNKDLNP